MRSPSPLTAVTWLPSVRDVCAKVVEVVFELADDHAALAALLDLLDADAAAVDAEAVVGNTGNVVVRVGHGGAG